MRTSRQSLAEAAARGEPLSFVFFWGHTPALAGDLDKSCLSQWWPAAFEVEGLRYASTEHFMMAEKARLFGDEEIRAQILAAPDPSRAKALGRKVRGFQEEPWVAHREDIVRRGNGAKFRQHPRLGAFLRRTAGQILVEASPVDPIWGIGLAADDPRAADPRQWRGENLLGFALMAVRDELSGEG